MPRIPFCSQSYKSRSLPVSSQRAVNVYAEIQPNDAKDQIPIFGVPGITSFATCGAGPIRRMWVLNSVLYVVSGSTLYSVNSSGVATILGTGVGGTGRVGMADNGTQLQIVNGVNGYIYSATSGFQLITDSNFLPANTSTFFDNFFVLDHVNTNQFFISASLDGTAYNALDIASAEVNSDFVLALINQQENLLIFGQRTIETWYDAGNVNFPFQRYDGATIERGCAALYTVIKEDNSVFFLGDDLIFYRLNGIVPVRISTHPLENLWSQYQKVSDAYCFSYTYQGHKWIVLTFPTGNATFVFDISTGLWHERISYDINYNSYKRWRINDVASVYNKVLVGDAFSGQIGFVDPTVNTEFGNPIKAFMIAPVIHSDRHRVFMSRFELDVESGVGNTNDPGSDPQIMLRWSDDGGRTFSLPQLWNSMGKIGEYQKRLRWLRMGSFRNRVMEVTITDPVRRTIIANNCDLKVGTS